MRTWNDGAVVKRLGYLVEIQGIPRQTERLERWQRLISRGISLLEPGAGKQGRVRTRWQVRVNVPIEEQGLSRKNR